MMAEREKILQALEEAHEQVVMAALGAAERRAQGPWGPREILAHSVGWEIVAIDCLPQLLPGEAPAPLPYEALNLAMATLAGDQPIDVFRAMLSLAHQRFLALPEVRDEASFVPGNPIYERTRAAIGHSLEHVQELNRLG